MTLARILLLTAMLLITVVSAPAQVPDVEWIRLYGNPDVENYGWEVQATADGGYVVAGSYTPEGQVYKDSYLIKTDSQGDTLWARAYGGSRDDEAMAIRQTMDGGFIVVGYYSDEDSPWRVKLYLIRTDGNGDTLWTKKYGAINKFVGRSVEITDDGGFIIAGWTDAGSGGGDRIYVARTDSAGDTLWTGTYGQIGSLRSWSVVPAPGGGFAIAGWTEYPGEDSEIYIIKINSQGEELWNRTFGTEYDDEARSIILDSEHNGYVIVGKTYVDTNRRSFLMKLDLNGDSLWTRTYGEGNGIYIANSVINNGTEGYTLASVNLRNLSSIFIAEVDYDGDVIWTKTIGGEDYYGLYPRSIIRGHDGGYVIAGYSGAPYVTRILLAKLETTQTGIDSDYMISPNIISLHQNYPNPFNATTEISYSVNQRSRITISIYNLAGQKVDTIFEGVLEPGEHSVIWDASAFPSGIYFARLTTQMHPVSIKMILLK